MLLLGDVAFLQHEIEHDVALLLGLLEVLVARRIVLRGVLRDGGDGRSLHDVEVLGGGVEVALRGALHAVQVVVAELGDVEIALQDLKLRILLLHLHGDEHLTHLARDGLLGGVVLGDRVVVLAGLHGEHVLHVLLGERGTALRIALLHERLEEGAHDALHVDAVMLEEAAVLTRHHGLLHDFRDVLDRHDGAVVGVELRDLRGAVGGVHHGFLRQGGHIEIDALDPERRHHGLGHRICGEYGGGNQRGHHHATADAQHDIGQQQSEHTSNGKGLLFRHAPHSKWVGLPESSPCHDTWNHSQEPHSLNAAGEDAERSAP